MHPNRDDSDTETCSRSHYCPQAVHSRPPCRGRCLWMEGWFRSSHRFEVTEQFGHECRNRRAFGSRECHVREERVSLQLLHHRNDPVVTAHPQVVALGNVMGEHDPAVASDSRKHREQDVALERLRLVDDDERVMK